MFKNKKRLEFDGHSITVNYSGLSGKLKVLEGERVILEKFLWQPYKSYTITLAEERYQVKALLFPVNSIGIYQDKRIICKSLFPKLKYTGLVTFSLSSIKGLALFLSLMMG
ncbi:hypothetical protein TUM4438_16390 [Shewanella sairae]|uniref:Uncharacterized protein n=1 Tax=Shewanella sairae TaxID=190310 RepID=A0ABQ4PC05_9GAMM|nr:hypothetical protein [Shewanella sairae]MCL1130178.1 hypothetical protein [Shewanella sairae]GIU44666.1 hypothetical protein TUM4438_16390 [Shewanella sairae]